VVSRLKLPGRWQTGGEEHRAAKATDRLIFLGVELSYFVFSFCSIWIVDAIQCRTQYRKSNAIVTFTEPSERVITAQSSARKNKAEKGRPKFHGRVLRLREFLLQNCAILRNAV
jgi:hypothetical protein